MLKTASKPVDVQDLHFKLQCRLNVFDKQEGSLSKTSKSLVASASRYGLVFVGCASAKLKVLGFESIESNSSTEASKEYPRREINLISEPHHISVNCDHTILAVVVLKDNCLSALFYDVLSFYKENVVLLNEVRLTSTPNLEVLQANWHPTLNNIFTECKSDGTLGIYELKDKSIDVKKLPAESKACCFCWSPKGKQIAVGSQNGKIIHYKPDLKAVKSIDAPPFDKPHSILSLQWISNYQFVGVFKTANETEPECSVILIDAPKTGNPTFTNFYDICYSNGNFRPPQFYLISEQHWNILLVASANSMEVGVLSNTGEIWTQWILPDSARAELPLDENQDETFPIGMTIDTSSDKPVLWGESYLQPAPCLLLLSHEGVLCCFKMVNLKEGAPSVNSPAEKVADMSGLRHFVTPAPEPVSTTQEVPILQQATKEATPSNVATPTPTNPPSMFSLPSSTPTSAPPVQPSSQGQQTPTTPLSIFKSPAPLLKLPSLPTNLFGSQISITPVKSKETAPPTSVASVGASLLSNILSEGSSTQKKEVTPASMASMPFSNLLSGSVPAQTTIIPVGKPSGLSSGVLGGTGTGNRLSGSGQLPAGGLQGTSFGVSSMPGSGPMQASPKPASGGAATQNVQFGLQRTETKPNVPLTVPNTTKPPALVKIDKNAEEKENAEIRNMLTKMIQMECLALEKEIKDLIIQGQHLKIPLKYDEMGQIVQNTDDINEFLKELVETCEIQSSEVHILKQNTIQSWAWVEEARSRYKESQDKELNILLKSKPLDSVSEKHLSTLKQMKYYLDSQLKQSHKALDDQWEKFQDYCRKNNKIQLPTMEAIFQTMVKQNAILQKHNYILKDISSQIKGKQKASNNAALFNPSDKKDNLEASFQNLKLEPENIYNIYYQKVLNRVKSVPPNKTNQLRRILHNREVPHVMAKSQLSTSALNSSLRTSQLSTSLKTPIGKKGSSQLYQSTPLNLTPESAPQIASTPLSAFAATSNLASKPQLSARFGSETQYTVPSSMPTASPLSGDKQSGIPQSQNSLFKTSTVNTNEKVGYNAFSNFGFGQEANQNRNNASSSTLSNSFSASTNLQSQKFTAPEPAVATSKQFVPVNPSVQNSNVITSTTPQTVKSTNVFGPSISSSAGSSQTGASNKLFSFVTSTGQSKELPGSTAVTSTTAGFSASIGSTMPSVGATAPSNTFASSFLNSASNGVSGFGKTAFGGTAGLFASSSNVTFGSDSFSNKDNVTASAQTTSGFTFGSPATSDAAVSSSGVSEIVPSETSNEAVPSTAASIFKFSTTTGSKPSFGSNLVSGSGSKPAATMFGVPISDTVSSTSSSSTSSTSGGVNSASSTFQFSSSVTSSDSVSTTTSSIFSLSLKKEESSDSKPAVSSTEEVSSNSKTLSGTSAEVSSSTKSIFGTAVTSTEASSGKSIFGANVTSSGTPSPGTFAFGNSASVSSTTPGEVSITSKSIFNTVSTTTPSLFGVTSTTGDLASGTSKSIFSNSATSTVPGGTNNVLSITSKSIFGASVSSSGAATETPDSKTDTAPTSTTSMINNAPSSNAGMISSTVPSIFGTTTSSSGAAKSIFGASATSSATVPSAPSIFGTSAASSGTAPAPSIFGASATSSGTTPSTSQSIFGASATSSAGVTSASKSIFGTSATSSGTAPTSSIFGVSSTSSGTTSTASKSIFGTTATSSVAAPSSSTSIFGVAATSSGSAPKSIFGASTTSSGTASTSIFGASATNSGTAPSSSASIFGASSTSSATAPSASTSIFGAAATSSGTASTSSIFGATATAGPLSLTKTTTPTVTSQPSPFGNAASSGSIFGNAATTGSPFGTGKSVFGSASPAASPFGSSAPVSSSPFSATPFGNTTSSNSVFGQATSTVSPFNTAAGATSPFSGTAANAQTPFGATPSTAESPFGAVTPSVCSPFGSQGFGTGFNANTTVQSSPFGQVSTPSNVFGSSNPTSASAFGTVSSSENASSPFGQSSGGMFGSFGSNSTKPAEGSFGFGDLNMGTASQSVFSKPNENKSPFGSTNFNPTTSSGSLFGNSSFGNNNGNSVFRQSAFGGSSVFSSTQQSGPFSGGAGSIAQSGFGIQTPQKPPAFGASPTFGGTPAFGSAPTFGGAPAFGSTPTFGSPNQVFGSASPAQAGSAFGSTNSQQSSGFGSFASQNSLGFGSLGQQQNNPAANSSGGSGFGSFASQNTIGFGNLAQQTNNAQNAPFSGASSFSSWR